MRIQVLMSLVRIYFHKVYVHKRNKLKCAHVRCIIVQNVLKVTLKSCTACSVGVPATAACTRTNYFGHSKVKSVLRLKDLNLTQLKILSGHNSFGRRTFKQHSIRLIQSEQISNSVEFYFLGYSKMFGFSKTLFSSENLQCMLCSYIQTIKKTK